MATAQAQQGPGSAEQWFQSHWSLWFDAQRNQWSEFFRQWQGGVAGKDAASGAGAYRDFFVRAGGQYLDMMQKFYEAAGQKKAPEDAAKEWSAGLQKFFLQMLEPANTGTDQNNYARFSESMMKAGAAWTSALHGAKNPEGFVFDPFGFSASMPGIGYTREKQEMYAELYKRWAAFQEKSNRYNAAMGKVGLEAVQKFQDYVVTPPKDAPPLTSLKSIYVKWVDICEDIYARYAMTREYTDLYGETVNALMRFKQQQNAVTDELVSELNLPTRKEIDTLHERAHSLRRDNLALKKEVAELKKAVFKAPVQKTPAKKPAAKKKGK